MQYRAIFLHLNYVDMQLEKCFIQVQYTRLYIVYSVYYCIGFKGRNERSAIE